MAVNDKGQTDGTVDPETVILVCTGGDMTPWPADLWPRPDRCPKLHEGDRGPDWRCSRAMLPGKLEPDVQHVLGDGRCLHDCHHSQEEWAAYYADPDVKAAITTLRAQSGRSYPAEDATH